MTMESPRRHTDCARLEIDEFGHARVILPPWKRMKLTMAEERTRHQAFEKPAHGYAKPVLPRPKTQSDFLEEMLASLPAVHLRVGQYPESYERTRLPEEDLDVGVHVDVNVEVEAEVEVAPRDKIDDDPVAPKLTRDDLPSAPACTKPSAPNAEEIEELEEEPEKRNGEEAPRQQRLEVGILPPAVTIKRADARTRLRYAVDVLTINDEKFIKLDDRHLLYATYADYLQIGENVTIRRALYRSWQGSRHAGRPRVLFELFPIGPFAYTAETGRRKKSPQEFRPETDEHGRVLLSALDRPLRYSNVMPAKVSTEIEGWEMEAVCRLDPDICHQDFIDRMIPIASMSTFALPSSSSTGLGAGAGGAGGRVSMPSKGTLNHRRRRDRMRMRVLPWPIPRKLSYSDSQVIRELAPWQREANTTAGLQDLTKEEIDMQCAIMYGGHLERSGGNAQNDFARLATFRQNLALVRTKFSEASKEVKLLKGRFALHLEKMGLKNDQSMLGP